MSDTNEWMAPRSLLFVPGDSERKQARALTSGADALILDLEDSVAEDRLPQARQQVREFLAARQSGGPQLWVRVNPLSGGKLLHDLRAIIAGRPDGVVLPKVVSPEEVIETGHYLSALEVREDQEPGSTRIIVIATETPRAVLNLHAYCGPLARLVGMTWGVEDLSAAVGASGEASAPGSLSPMAQLAQSACLLAANAVEAAAFDSVYTQFRDAEGLKRDAERARQYGFVGKLAIHPDQVAPINEAFTPSAEELREAQRVVDAFAAAPTAGVLSIDGRMVDRPHLVKARRILSRARPPA